MSGKPYIFPVQQAEFLRAFRDGLYRTPLRASNIPSAVSLVSKMPPVHEQSIRGTCVANAVTAMLEYYEDCKTRLSVQYLFAATKELERKSLEMNLARLRKGEPLDDEFEQACHKKLLQLRMMADANGGIDSPVMRPYLMQFEESVRSGYESLNGSLLQSCFYVLGNRGICRYALWPYAGASAAPLFGSGERITFPPGSDADAGKHRVLSQLYLLSSPNNVDEIRGIIAGTNNRRPMPVCITVSFFENRDGGTFTFPETEETEDGLAAADRWLGVHGMLIVGYKDDTGFPGGGYFIVRNSLGEKWGDGGYGKLPYAYAACFALEAGTILQDMLDYTGDGYGGTRPDAAALKGVPSRERHFTLLNIVAAAVLVAGTWIVAKRTSPAPGGEVKADPAGEVGNFSVSEVKSNAVSEVKNVPADDVGIDSGGNPGGIGRPSRPPFVEVTVYGRNPTVGVALPPPWNNVKGMAIDGGRVFRLPAKSREEVENIRAVLETEPALREKRGKPFTYDLVSFFDLSADDVDELKRAIGLFAAEYFPVRIEGEKDGVLRVSTVSPLGLRMHLERLYDLETPRKDKIVLRRKRKEQPSEF